jgi:hypothetical protein
MHFERVPIRLYQLAKRPLIARLRSSKEKTLISVLSHYSYHRSPVKRPLAAKLIDTNPASWFRADRHVG